MTTAQQPGAHFDIPDLRLLPAEAMVLHEHADPKRVARLEVRLRSDGFLKSPPIVAPMPGTERYVVLDGANRTSALRQIGSIHILAQVVGYKSEAVQLLTWHHLITGRTPSNFLHEIGEVQGLRVERAPLPNARALLRARDTLAYIVSPQGDSGSEPLVYVVDRAPGTERNGTEGETALLNSMVDTYKGDPQVTIHRVSSDELDELSAYYDDVSGLVVFPPYSPDDILKLAEAGTKVPTGITRHIISPRALRVNVPLALLLSDAPLKEKNSWWHEQFKRKLASNEIRLYQEATYLFDE